MKIGTIFSGLAGIAVVVLIAVGIICGVQLNGKIFIGFDNFTVEAKYKKHSVTWIGFEGNEVEKDTDLESGDISYFDSTIPEIEGYRFIKWTSSSGSVELSDAGRYYIRVSGSNITCEAVYESLETVEETL